MLNWQDAVNKPGAIIAYLHRPDNAPHHSGPFGRWISSAQSLDPSLDHEVTHVGIVRGMSNKTPLPGNTQLDIVDTLDGDKVNDRITERNFAIEIYYLKEGLILQHEPLVTSDMLATKALEVAELLKGIPYDRIKLLSLIVFRAYRENVNVDIEYTQWLCERFRIDLKNGTFAPNKASETFICPELVISSYQIAWLLLAGKQAASKPLPEWLNIRAGVASASLVKFLRESPFFEPVAAEHIHALRYSGTPHPNDGPTPDKHEPLGYSTVRFSVEKYLPPQQPLNTTKAKL